MGTVLTGYGDAGYDHEGYAAQVLDNNSITGTYSDKTRPPDDRPGRRRV